MSHSHDRVMKSGTRQYLNCKKIINEATTTTTKSKQSRTENNNYEGLVGLLEIWIVTERKKINSYSNTETVKIACFDLAGISGIIFNGC